MGTVDYMAPEQAVNPKNADERADVYSLGVTLWYLLSGRHLYEGETVLEKLVAHREQKIPSLQDVCSDATPELDAVFQRMVAKKPQQRYRSMTELIADLERCRIDPCSSPTINIEPDDGKQLKAFLEGIIVSSGQKTAAVATSVAVKTAVSTETLVEGDSTTDAGSLSGSQCNPARHAGAIGGRSHEENHRCQASASSETASPQLREQTPRDSDCGHCNGCGSNARRHRGGRFWPPAINGPEAAESAIDGSARPAE